MSALLLSIPSGADRLGIGRTKFYELANAGVIPTVQVGTRRLVRDSDLVAYAESLPASRPQDVPADPAHRVVPAYAESLPASRPQDAA